MKRITTKQWHTIPEVFGIVMLLPIILSREPFTLIFIFSFIAVAAFCYLMAWLHRGHQIEKE